VSFPKNKYWMKWNTKTDRLNYSTLLASAWTNRRCGPTLESSLLSPSQTTSWFTLLFMFVLLWSLSGGSHDAPHPLHFYFKS
jgi:hypothetical protein